MVKEHSKQISKGNYDGEMFILNFHGALSLSCWLQFITATYRCKICFFRNHLNLLRPTTAES